MRGGHGEHGDIHLMAGEPRLHLVHRLHERAVHVDADERRGDIEDRLNVEAFLREARIVRHRAADVARADDDDVILMGQAQNLADPLLEVGDVIAVALLAEPAEAVDVLADLGGGQIHALAQLLRGNAHHARLFQIAQMTIIHRQPAHNRVRHPRLVSHL